MSTRLVIANRGEIARRILRAARLRGWTVAVASTPEDADALVRQEADAVLEVHSFLDGPALVAAAQAWGARFLHPGYGFLSESADFAEAVEAAGLVFVGPRPDAMRALGSKEAAKARARALGVPVLPALLHHELQGLDLAELGRALEARGLTCPCLVKASGGGGGRGMRVVKALPELPEALARASAEAAAGFGDPTVFVERYLPAPRHIEVQIFGDGEGGGVFLGERECSLQRRHQKVLEECPSAVLAPPLREAMGRAALALVADVRYRGAGTVEFLLEPDGRFHFLEVNARLQVEHPVTEEVLGIDLVSAQFDLAEGRWPAALGDPHTFQVPAMKGVSVEARLLAEDPRHGFLPTPGPLRTCRFPEGPGLRLETGVAEGGRVNDRFDPMIAKLIATGRTREEAFARLAGALARTVIHGCTTNLPFLLALARHPDVVDSRTSTAWISEHLLDLDGGLLSADLEAFLHDRPFREALSNALRGLGAPVDAPTATFARQRHPDLTVLGRRGTPPFRLLPRCEDGWLLFRTGHDPLPFEATRVGEELWLTVQGDTLRLRDPLAHLSPSHLAAGAGDGEIRSPMAGTVLEVRASQGDEVEEGQVLFVLESMKMQMEVRAPFSGCLAEVFVEAGQNLPGPEPMGRVQAREQVLSCP